MKNKIGLLFVLFLLMSCSDNGDENQSVVTYGATIEKTCKGAKTTYCVTKETYEYLNALPFTGSACDWVRFKDIDGNNISGYLRSFGTPCN